MNNALTTIDPIRTALANATSIDDLKQVKDMAEAAKAWAKSRKLGIEAENDAAEYVLRAERGIGQQLGVLRDEGRYGIHTGIRDTSSVVEIVETLRTYGPTSSADLARLIPSVQLDTIKASLTDYEFFIKPEYGGKWALDEPKVQEWERLREGRVTRAELGLSDREARDFQKLASLPDDTFEQLLTDVRAGGARIAKVNFYRHDRKDKEPAVTYEDPDFNMFRQGAMRLLGWVVDDEHPDGYSTLNGLKQLPNDELSLLARLIGSLVKSYNEAKADRG